MSIRQVLYFILVGALILPGSPAQARQPGVPGFAEITNPEAGQAINGLITVSGTADHPDFDSYELYFAHDPNTTETWFPLTERIETPVQQEGLALWDSAQITPGTYQLRLVVHTGAGQTLEAIVAGLKLGARVERNEAAPGGGPQEITGETAQDQEAENSPEAATGFDEAQTVAAPTPSEILWRVLSLGALGALLAMLAFGTYSLMRPRVRDYLGLLKMRRLHQQQRRAQRRQRDRQ